MPNDNRRSRAAVKKRAEGAASRAKDRRVVRVAAAVLVLATVAAYHNSLGGPFFFDNVNSIYENPSIRQLWPIGQPLSPPSGSSVSGRPILNLSLAVNYALSENDVGSYHVVNLAIHVMAVLLLFGIVRRTLLLESVGGRLGSAAPYLALAVAMLWAVHPLQTESVTYIIQRAESLMGLFYLLTLYCVIRCSASRPVLWSLAAVACCAMGMATKEVMATAPVIALLYDRTFLTGSFLGALRKRWGLYAGLFACWGLLAFLMAWAGNRSGTVGFGAKGVVDWWSYAQAEWVAVLHYLRLSVWPDSLCLDYGPSTVRTLPEILSGAVVEGLLALATIWGLLRGRKWGFLGAWFLVILAPTSSVVPLRDPVFEHRMYLSLAAVASAAGLGGFLLWRKLTQTNPWFRDWPAVARWAVPVIVLAAVSVALGSLTIARNDDYRTSLAINRDTAYKNPTNARAQVNFGLALCGDSDVSLGIERMREAVRLAPQDGQVRSILGDWLCKEGQTAEAIEQLRQAVRIAPDNAFAHGNLGLALFRSGQLDQAVEELRESIRLDPREGKPHNSLGLALYRQGKFEASAAEFREAIRLSPQSAQACRNLAIVLDKLGRNGEAAEARNHADALKPAGGPPKEP